MAVAVISEIPGGIDFQMNYIFNGSIIDSIWQDGLEQLLHFWLTGRLPSPWSAYRLDHVGADVFQPKVPAVRPLPVVTVPQGNPHRLQRDFLLHQAGFPPRAIRVSSSNGPLGNVAVIHSVPVNNQPVAGPCLIWRGSLSGTRNGSDGGYAQYGGKALHRLMYEESRGEGLASEDKVLHLCHRRACIQPSHLYLGSDADNAEDRARRFRQPYLPDIPDGMEPLEHRLRASLFSDFDRLQLEFARSGKEHSRAWYGANYAIMEIPMLETPAPARFLVHECVPGPWAGSVHICQICNMTPGEIKRLPLLENLLAWDRAHPQQCWEYEESTKPAYEWLRRSRPGDSA